jgi:hypothetical protein
MGSCTWAISALFILSSYLTFSLSRILKKSEKETRWSPKTLRMQWMLFRTFFYTNVSAIVLLVVPVLLICIIAFSRIQAYSAPIVNLLASIESLHSIVDYTILMYFITPYRQFCIKCFKRIFICVKFKNQNQIFVKSTLNTAPPPRSNITIAIPPSVT